MGLGTNYDKKHAGAVNLLRPYLRDLDDISWTSDPTPWGGPTKVYNCFGFAVDSREWWQDPSIPGDPEGDPRFYWPENLRDPNNYTPWMASYVAAAESLGFEDCGQDSSWEDGHERIALIHSRGLFVHAALQVSPTRWKSKLGELSDFEHSLDSIMRAYPAHRIAFLKRERQSRTLT